MKVDYNKGKVYMIEPIVEHDESDIYIGSTTEDYLSKRFNNHKCMYKRWLNGKTHKVSVFNLFDKYGVDNCKIILLENVHANTKDELISRESFYIRKLKCINKVIPDRSREEYRQKNKDILSNKQKEYYEANKDELLNKQKEYYQTNKDELLNKQKEYYQTNKDELLNKQKEYYQTNKDEILNYKKEYYQTNKDEILNYKKEYYKTNKNKINEKVDCIFCNCKVRKYDVKKHYKSIKHINNLISFNNQIDNHIKRIKQIVLTLKHK
jgi:hypothetical protein